MSPAELVAQVPTTVWLLVDALAVYRLTRLITRDSLPPIQHARNRVLDRWGTSPWSELAVCPWCMSVWIAGPVIVARLETPTWWSPLALLLAYSTVTGQLSERE